MKNVVRALIALAMIAIGVAHFVAPAGFVKIVPAFLPYPYALVLISGAFEALFGAGLLLPQTRRLSGLGLIALYIAVFPANVAMAVHQIQPDNVTLPVWVFWARLPMQIVFIALAWWVSHERAPKR